MKKTSKKEIFTKTEIELKKSLDKAKEELSSFITDNSQFKLKNTRQIFNKRREIAQILTVIREKELSKK